MLVKRINVFILFLIPILVAITAIFIFPLAYTFYLSFFDFKPGTGSVYVGTGNFEFLFGEEEFLLTIARTFAYMIGVVVVNFILGFGLAMLTYKPFRGVSIIRTIIITPMLFIPAAASVIWAMMFQPEVGLINHILEYVGIGRIAFLGKSDTAMLSVMFVDIWGWTPFVYLILTAGLQSLPNEPFESAELDGASSIQTLRYVTLPMLRPIILIAFLIKAIDTFRAFDYVWIMTRGGPGYASMILAALAYRTAFIEVHFGRSSAIAVVFFVLSLILTALIIYYYTRRE